MTIKLPSAKALYLDANLIIYYFERDDALHDCVAALLSQAVLDEIPVMVSEIGVAECLYGAFRLQSAELEANYREFFYELPLVRLIPVDGEKLIAAAALGASKRLKLVDAVHFQSAVECGCDVFVTNDRRSQSSHGVSVLQLEEIEVGA